MPTLSSARRCLRKRIVCFGRWFIIFKGGGFLGWRVRHGLGIRDRRQLNNTVFPDVPSELGVSAKGFEHDVYWNILNPQFVFETPRMSWIPGSENQPQLERFYTRLLNETVDLGYPFRHGLVRGQVHQRDDGGLEEFGGFLDGWLFQQRAIMEFRSRGFLGFVRKVGRLLGPHEASETIVRSFLEIRSPEPKQSKEPDEGDEADRGPFHAILPGWFSKLQSLDFRPPCDKRSCDQQKTRRP
jgi:hypothetical protein